MRRFFLLIIFAAIFSLCFSQNNQWLSYTNGKSITCQVQDSDYIWIGTSGGLVKYNKIDGSREYLNQTNSGLPDNYIYCIEVDAVGSLWIGTAHGLAKFDGTSWQVYNTDNSGIGNCLVRYISIGAVNTIWIASNYTVSKFENNVWTFYDDENGLPQPWDFEIHGIQADNQGILWIGTATGLVKFTSSSYQIYHPGNSTDNDNVSALAKDNQGRIWISTTYIVTESQVVQGHIDYISLTLGKLFMFDGSTWTNYTYTDPPHNNAIYSIYFDWENSMWLGLYNAHETMESNWAWDYENYKGGIYKFNVSLLEQYYPVIAGNPDPSIRNFSSDGLGNVWIGTPDGLSKFNGSIFTDVSTCNSELLDFNISNISVSPSGYKWLSYNLDFTLSFFKDEEWMHYSNPDIYGQIMDIDFDNNGRTWICAKYFLGTYDGDNWSFDQNQHYGYGDYYINCMVIDNNNNRWLGYGKQLLKLVNEAWIVYQPPFIDQIPENSSIKCIATDSQNCKWLGYYGYGIVKFNGTNWTVYNQENTGFDLSDINVLEIDNQDNVWIGTFNNGLIRFDGTSWTDFNMQNTEITGNWVTSVKHDLQNNIWSSYYNYRGFVKFDGTTWTFYNATDNKLLENTVNMIAIDSLNNKWIGTTNGLAVFNENGIVSSSDVVNNHPSVTNELINYPNPFNPETVIKYNLGQNAKVDLSIYNIKGQLVRKLANEIKLAGTHEIVWNGKNDRGNNLASGIYFSVLKTGKQTLVRKLLLLK